MARAPQALQLERVGSPIGDLLVAALGDAVCAIAFEGGEEETERYLARRYGEASAGEGARCRGEYARR